MPGILLSPDSRPTAMKRPADDFTLCQLQAQESQHDDSRPAKRARTHHHTVKFRQSAAVQALQGVQDDVFFQAQLLRSITLSLSAQGFDSVNGTALEGFRLATETYMLQFLKTVTSSMQGSRREAPTPEDFAIALARSKLTSSDFIPFLSIPPNPSICQPTIPPLPDTDKMDRKVDNTLESILRDPSDAVQTRQKHVPKHFPVLPSGHTWKTTPIFQNRAQDARILREKATQEGIMAEQALRRLTEASKINAQGDSVKDTELVPRGRSARSWDRALKIIVDADGEEQDQESRLQRELSSPIPPAMGATVAKIVPSETFESAAVVNSGRLRWRELARRKN